MLTPDDSTRDGNFRAYLDQPERYESFDSELFGLLRDRIVSSAPSVALIEEIGVLPAASWYREQVPDGGVSREEWRAQMLLNSRGRDLVFFDPDNGLEVRSKPIGRKGSSKYVFWKEIQGVWDAGSSVVIYQHLPRAKREVLAQRLKEEFIRRTGASQVAVFSSPSVLFLFSAQDKHAQQFQAAITSFESSFTDHVKVIESTIRSPGRTGEKPIYRMSELGRRLTMLSRVKDSFVNGLNREFHVLTYAEEGFSPLSIHAERFSLTREAVSKFADTVNSQSEAGSLFPVAPISAVPRALVRDSQDIDALAASIGDFLTANRGTIKAQKLIFDFRTPSVPTFVVAALNAALESNPNSLVDEVFIVEK